MKTIDLKRHHKYLAKIESDFEGVNDLFAFIFLGMDKYNSPWVLDGEYYDNHKNKEKLLTLLNDVDHLAENGIDNEVLEESVYTWYPKNELIDEGIETCLGFKVEILHEIE